MAKKTDMHGREIKESKEEGKEMGHGIQTPRLALPSYTNTHLAFHGPVLRKTQHFNSQVIKIQHSLDSYPSLSLLAAPGP